MKYWIRNIVKNRSQLRKDLGLPKIIKSYNQNFPLLIDTSISYAGSETVIGENIKNFNRNNLFIVTKIGNHYQYNHNVFEGFERSLHALGLDYIDLYLMHWPVEGEYINTWKEMEKIYERGLTKAIGVCNCKIHHLEELKKHAKIMPMVNQVECSPLFTQNELRDYCNKNDIQVMAYTPTARMDERLRKTIIPVLAKKYNKTMAQIIIRWHIQLGNIPIVNTYSVKHFNENYDVFDFELLPEEVEKITAININSRLRYDSDNCDFRQL